MFNFFKGWRRKLGCVALAIAALVTVSWVSSLRTRTTGWFRTDYAFYRFQNSNSSFIAFIDVNDPESEFSPYLPTYSWSHSEHQLGEATSPPWPAIGFEHGRFWIAHWMIAVPLTVLAGYLILWRPRTKPKVDPSSSAQSPIPNP